MQLLAAYNRYMKRQKRGESSGGFEVHCCQIKGYAAIPSGAVVPVLLNWHLRSLFRFRKHNTVMGAGV